MTFDEGVIVIVVIAVRRRRCARQPGFTCCYQGKLFWRVVLELLVLQCWQLLGSAAQCRSFIETWVNRCVDLPETDDMAEHPEMFRKHRRPFLHVPRIIFSADRQEQSWTPFVVRPSAQLLRTCVSNMQRVTLYHILATPTSPLQATTPSKLLRRPDEARRSFVQL